MLATDSEGIKHYVLVLEEGDEVATALADFAHEEHVVNAHFVASTGLQLIDPSIRREK
jgi:predicted DNA-binding protein with PD1-like motif